MIYGILIGILIIVPILIAYYYDFKSDPKEFTFSVKTLGKGLIYIGIYVAIIAVYKLVIPFNKNYGIEFNSEREKLGIPILGKDWKVDDVQSEQFETYWWKSEPRNGHFKKVIEYGILKAKSETDYYQNESMKETFAWSKYDFESHKFEYFLEKPNREMISVTKNGNLKMEKPTIIVKINKEVFDKYTAK